MTQNELIRDHLDLYGSITSKEAMDEYGIMRLASRIADLKKTGMAITTKTEKGKNRYGKSVAWVRYEKDDQ